jgi:hypothetical protein
MFLNHFDVLILKIIFKNKKNIILMNTLKKNPTIFSNKLQKSGLLQPYSQLITIESMNFGPYPILSLSHPFL